MAELKSTMSAGKLLSTVDAVACSVQPSVL